MGEMICPNCKPNFTNDDGAWAGVVSCPYHSLMDAMVVEMARWHDRIGCNNPTCQTGTLLAKARAAKAGAE